jgi:hypothetical protein
MSHPSLEHRLNTRIDTAIAIYLIVFAAALGLLLARAATKDFDRALMARAGSIIEIARQEVADAAGPEAPAGGLIPRFEGMNLGEFAIWLSDGTLVGSVDSLAALDIQVETPLSDVPAFADVELPDGRRGRKVEIDFVPRTRNGHELQPSQVAIGSGITTATLVVAESRRALDHRLLEIALMMVGGCALLLVSLAALVHSSLRRGLAPVIGLRRQVERLGPRGTVHRVSLRNPPEELAPVVAGINELLRNQRLTDPSVPGSDTDGMARAS